ncbi:MAG: hypothetical protein QXU54_01420 [Candidatus Micrarchaeia archaeon]
MLGNIRRLNETGMREGNSEYLERSYTALRLVAIYTENVLGNNIEKGAGREEMEAAIAGYIQGREGSLEVFGKAYKDNLSYLMEKQKKASQEAISSLLNLESRKMRLDNMIGAVDDDIKKLEMMTDLPGHDQMLQRAVSLKEKLVKLRESFENTLVPDKLTYVPEKILKLHKEFLRVGKEFSKLKSDSAAYLFVGYQLLKEKDYQLFQKINDPQVAGIVKGYSKDAVEGLESSLAYIAKGDIESARAAFARAIDRKMRLAAIANISREKSGIEEALSGVDKSNEFDFYKKGCLAVFDAYSTGRIGVSAEAAKLSSNLIAFEDAIRMSTERLFVTGEAELVKSIISDSKEIIQRRTVSIISGKPIGNDVTAYLGGLERDVGASWKALEEKMECGERRARWVMIGASLLSPEVFIVDAINNIATQASINKGEVTWDSWVMLGLAVMSHGLAGQAMSAIASTGRAGEVAVGVVRLAQAGAGVGMLGLGVVGACEMFAQGKNEEALEMVAQMALPIFHYPVKKFVVAKGRQYYEMLRNTDYRKLFVTLVSEKRGSVPASAFESQRTVLLAEKPVKVPKATGKKAQVAAPAEKVTKSPDFITPTEKFLKLDKETLENFRREIPTGQMKVFSNTLITLMKEGYYAVVLSSDKSGLSKLNSLSRRLGDASMDVYVNSLRRLGALIRERYGEDVIIVVQRTSESSDEVYFSLLCKDKGKLASIMNELWKIHDEIVTSASAKENLYGLAIDGIPIEKYLDIIGLRNPKQFYNLTIGGSKIHSLRLENGNWILVNEESGKLKRKVVSGVDGSEAFGEMVLNAENEGVKIGYKRRMFHILPKKVTLESLMKMFGIKGRSGILFKTGKVEEGVTPQAAFEVKVSLDMQKGQQDEMLRYVFGEKVGDEYYGTRKGLVEVLKNLFGMRGLNTFFGHAGLDAVATAVDEGVAAFMAANTGVEIMHTGPLKYVVVKGWTPAVEAELTNYITKSLQGKKMKMKANINSATVNSLDGAFEVLLSKSLGRELSTQDATKMVKSSNFIIAAFSELQPQKIDAVFESMPPNIKSVLKEIFSSDDNCRIIRNVEDLFAYIDMVAANKKTTPETRARYLQFKAGYLDFAFKMNLEKYQAKLTE